MDMLVAPEITALEAFLTALKNEKGTNAPALAVIGAVFRQTHPEAGDSLHDLMRVLFSLPTLVAEMPKGGYQTTAKKALEALNKAFSVEAMSLDWANYRAQYYGSIDVALATISNFHDVTFDSAGFIEKSPDLYAAIERLGEQFGKTEMSDASKSVLEAQLVLLRNSVGRFQATGVGPFRDSAYSILGRVVIQIHSDAKISADDRLKLVEDFLKVVSVVQTAGDLAKLVGPPIVKLLTGPA
jgi:hypothetical protein